MLRERRRRTYLKKEKEIFSSFDMHANKDKKKWYQLKYLSSHIDSGERKCMTKLYR